MENEAKKKRQDNSNFMVSHSNIHFDDEGVRTILFSIFLLYFLVNFLFPVPEHTFNSFI